MCTFITQNWFDIIFVIISVSFSFFLGNLMPRLNAGEDYKKLTNHHKIRNHIISGLMPLIGFSIMYYEIKKVCFSISSETFTFPTFPDIVILVVSLFAVSGYLPYLLFDVSIKATDIIKGKS